MRSPMRGLRLVAAVALIALALPSVALADDPTADPRCADATAAAGIDLQLICTANEVVGAYTGRPGAVKAVGAPDGSVIGPAAVALLAGAGLIAAIVIVVRRRAGERLAPSVPEEWWTCPACRSLNAGGMPRCYACQAARPTGEDAAAEVLRREP